MQGKKETKIDIIPFSGHSFKGIWSLITRVLTNGLRLMLLGESTNYLTYSPRVLIFVIDREKCILKGKTYIQLRLYLYILTHHYIFVLI